MLGSIAMKGDKFIESIKKRHDTLVLEVARENRDVLQEDIMRIIDENL